MNHQNTILITCGRGISDILKQEVIDLGFKPVQVNALSVELKGTIRDCMYLNLHLRTANKVMLFLKRFRAAHPNQLYNAVSKIPWEDYISTSGYISVTSHINNRYILDTRFGNQKVKDAKTV